MHSLIPVRKRIPRRILKRKNELPHSRSSFQQLAQQPFQLLRFPAIPLRRNLLRQRPHRALRKRLDPAQPRLKRLPPCDTRINIVAPEHPAQRRIRKTPLSRIEAISLVDKARRKLTLAAFLPERGLSPVGVACPLVER